MTGSSICSYGAVRSVRAHQRQSRRPERASSGTARTDVRVGRRRDQLDRELEPRPGRRRDEHRVRDAVVERAAHGVATGPTCCPPRPSRPGDSSAARRAGASPRTAARHEKRPQVADDDTWRVREADRCGTRGSRRCPARREASTGTSTSSAAGRSHRLAQARSRRRNEIDEHRRRSSAPGCPTCPRLRAPGRAALRRRRRPGRSRPALTGTVERRTRSQLVGAGAGSDEHPVLREVAGAERRAAHVHGAAHPRARDGREQPDDGRRQVHAHRHGRRARSRCLPGRRPAPRRSGCPR